MRIEEFTHQGFKKCPPELLPSLQTPYNQGSTFFVKQIYEINEDRKHYMVVEENGVYSKIKILHAGENAGWIEHIMDLNIE